MVNCDDTKRMTLGTKLKIPIFTLYLPHKLQSRVLVFQKIMYRDNVSNQTCQNFREKCSDQEVNAKIGKDLNTQATRPNFH